LTLLAAHFNIDASKALTIQARIWENPTITADLNAYNPTNNKYFDIGIDGQKAFSIQQIIYMGGKKRNEVALAKTNEQIAELQFSDLLRNLKLQLRKSFFTVYFNSKNIENSDKQIGHIEELVNSYSVQAQKGNIALKELVRLQSLFLNLKNERNEIINSTIEEQGNLKLLLSETQNIVPSVTDADITKYTKNTFFDVKNLEKIAIENRPDYQQRQKIIEANQFNLKWQKSLSVPDITLGAGFDQRSGAFNNQVDAFIGIPLPLWNKNKGNIKFAQMTLEQSKVDFQNNNLQLITEIDVNYKKWQEATNNFNQLKQQTINDFETVYNGILENFQKRNISLLEFTDFMESYSLAALQINELKRKLVFSGEQLNTTINKDLF
jgi:cobalt-zinc-cadmium efflux system outer membrane protein